MAVNCWFQRSWLNEGAPIARFKRRLWRLIPAVGRNVWRPLYTWHGLAFLNEPLVALRASMQLIEGKEVIASERVFDTTGALC